MDAALITTHVNPLKKLREVLTTCGRGRSVCGQRNEVGAKQWPACSRPLIIHKLRLSAATQRRWLCGRHREGDKMQLRVHVNKMLIKNVSSELVILILYFLLNLIH